jgi:hypothetical protein
VSKKKKIKQKKNTITQLGTNVMAGGLNARLLAGSQFASGRSCDRPTRSRFSVVFLGTRANAELIPTFHVALHVSHAALPMVTLKISPYTNVNSTFDFDFAGSHCSRRIWVREPYTEKKVSNCQTKKLKSGRQTIGRNITY